MGKSGLNIPFHGAGPQLQLPVGTLLMNLDKQILFRARWKTGGNAEQLLQHLLQDPRVLESIRPEAVYGYFPARREATGLLVADRVFWEFPVLKGKRLSERFRNGDEGGGYLALSAVTIGAGAVSLSQEYYLRRDYAEYFLLYGLAAELTETLAEYVNRHINHELEINSSLRRSFGYPACPDLAYQQELLDLLRAQRIHLHLSWGMQLIPEFSTTALIFPDTDLQEEENE